MIFMWCKTCKKEVSDIGHWAREHKIYRRAQAAKKRFPRTPSKKRMRKNSRWSDIDKNAWKGYRQNPYDVFGREVKEGNLPRNVFGDIITEKKFKYGDAVYVNGKPGIVTGSAGGSFYFVHLDSGKNMQAYSGDIRKMNPHRRKKRGVFRRGKIARAKRDVLARKLARHADHIKTPYALSTYMVKRGVHVKGKRAIAREFAEQKRMARKNPYELSVGTGFPYKYRKGLFKHLVADATQKLRAKWSPVAIIDYYVAEGMDYNLATEILRNIGRKNPYDTYGRRFEKYFTDRSGIVRPLASKAIRRREHWETHATPLRRYTRANARKRKVQKVRVRIGRRLFIATRAEVAKLKRAGFREMKRNPRFVGGRGKMTAIEYKGTDGAHYRHDFKTPRHFEVEKGALVAVPVSHSTERGIVG